MTFDEPEESSTVTNAHSHGFHSDRERVSIPREQYPSISARRAFFRHFSFLKSANRKPGNSDDTERVKFRAAIATPPHPPTFFSTFLLTKRRRENAVKKEAREILRNNGDARFTNGCVRARARDRNVRAKTLLRVYEPWRGSRNFQWLPWIPGPAIGRRLISRKINRSRFIGEIRRPLEKESSRASVINGPQ